MRRFVCFSFIFGLMAILNLAFYSSSYATNQRALILVEPGSALSMAIRSQSIKAQD